MLLLVVGTAWGEDDHFPFGPFKMYSRATRTTGRVTWLELEGRDAAGRTKNVTGDDVGLRRAELEGQMPRFRDDPDLLAALAEAWRRIRPGEPELVEIRVIAQAQDVVDSTPVGEPVERVVLTWQR